MPNADDEVDAGVLERDEVEDGNVAGRGEGTRCGGPREHEDGEQEGGDDPPAEQAVEHPGCAAKRVHGKGGRPVRRCSGAAWRNGPRVSRERG